MDWWQHVIKVPLLPFVSLDRSLDPRAQICIHFLLILRPCQTIAMMGTTEIREEHFPGTVTKSIVTRYRMLQLSSVPLKWWEEFIIYTRQSQYIEHDTRFTSTPGMLSLTNYSGGDLVSQRWAWHPLSWLSQTEQRLALRISSFIHSNQVWLLFQQAK